MLRLRIGCMGRATVFREFDITPPKLFTPTLTLFTRAEIPGAGKGLRIGTIEPPLDRAR